MLVDHLPRWALRALSHPRRGFGPAMVGERLVFGARRPGYPLSRVPPAFVDEWLAFMCGRGIRRVVCLLPEGQLAYYPGGLLGRYRAYFGAGRVCWAPTEDFTLVDEHALINMVLPFLFGAERQREPVVIHCSGGIGRTGHVAAAWLVARHGHSNRQAIETVRRMGRNAREARDPRLDVLLDRCRQIFVRA